MKNNKILRLSAILGVVLTNLGCLPASASVITNDLKIKKLNFNQGSDELIKKLGITNDLKVKKFDLGQGSDELIKKLGITNDLKVKDLFTNNTVTADSASTAVKTKLGKLAKGIRVSIVDIVNTGDVISVLPEGDEKEALFADLSAKTKDEVLYIVDNLGSYKLNSKDIKDLRSAIAYTCIYDITELNSTLTALNTYAKSTTIPESDTNSTSLDAITNTYGTGEPDIISDLTTPTTTGSVVTAPSGNHRGWLLGAGGWKFYDNNGTAKVGWLSDGGKWYYLDNEGTMKTGWLKDNDANWYYLNSDGSMASNTTISGYTVGEDGKLV